MFLFLTGGKFTILSAIEGSMAFNFFVFGGDIEQKENIRINIKVIFR